VTERFESPDLIAVTAEDPAPDYAAAVFAAMSEGNHSRVEKRAWRNAALHRLRISGGSRKRRELLTRPS
jgi:hypothetical protein